ncbi:MAG: hypothetical protein LBU65_13090, partial [Planctomycetaceae bacterium]|nr:hypothetical protein [Planctomycetaceae bacterium]
MRFTSLIITLLLASISAAAEIRFVPWRVTVTNEVVFLGDIAEIEPANDDDLESLSRVILFASPEAG